MAQARSRRLRKKLHIDEFQELGFSVSFRFPEGTSVEDIDQLMDKFVDEVIEPQGLAFEGSGYLHWEGLICLQKLGHCTEEHRQLVSRWLEEQKLTAVKVSDLFDIWWDLPENLL
ncbi:MULTISPECIES: YggL family protein [Pectobacterium]|uniref:YggL family protein n=1 Tax=Pectobacterium TaxID=122277 RepID=UPI001889223F|nr:MULTISPECIES: YggL family protein [Pectobacterium]MBG0751642.1 protein yggL [Pectobacterium carotovorum subsp. carotovorum PCCS1]QPI42233.1 YggL family protein [Pectobacterium aroidearum]UUE44158.1 YggL family protein [Pectobacterium aroidearum]UUE48377.1 YggL family protein [Pectobacterium aroidearum]UUE52582.1 YggL family protein [Pectobacterium aroidearum]